MDYVVPGADACAGPARGPCRPPPPAAAAGPQRRRRGAQRHRRLTPGEPCRPDVADLHEALLARGETVAAAESLTAGLFCATLAEVPGASATLRGGVVVYATELKPRSPASRPTCWPRTGR